MTKVKEKIIKVVIESFKLGLDIGNTSTVGAYEIYIKHLETAAKTKAGKTELFANGVLKIPSGLTRQIPSTLHTEGEQVYKFGDFYVGQGAVNGSYFSRRMNKDKWDPNYLAPILYGLFNDIFAKHDGLQELVKDTVAQNEMEYFMIDTAIGMPKDYQVDGANRLYYQKAVTDAAAMIADDIGLMLNISKNLVECAEIDLLYADKLPEGFYIISADPGFGTFDITIVDPSRTQRQTESHAEYGLFVAQKTFKSQNLQSRVDAIENDIIRYGSRKAPKGIMDIVIDTLSRTMSVFSDNGVPVALLFSGGGRNLLSRSDKSRLEMLFNKNVVYGSEYDNARLFLLKLADKVKE